MIRAKENPLITTKDIKPSNPSLKVDGVFNCGATKYQDKYVLLLRIAESALTKKDYIDVPQLNSDNEIVIKSIHMLDDKYNFDDTRIIKHHNRKVAFLTSLSHFRRAISYDGIHFEIDEKPWILPHGKMEAWGIEDPRITKIDDRYLITYTAVSEYGVSVGLIETSDFETFERKGIILPVDNKDVSILPEKVNNKYYLYHRPIPTDIGYPNMWSATSKNLTHWGEHKLLLEVSKEGWDNGRVGGGAPSFKTKEGWLHIYHAATEGKAVYRLGAFLTSLEDPTTIIKKTDEPILSPEENYEKEGFFSDVVFTCGLVVEDENVMIYYGAADDKICLATTSVSDILSKLKKVK